MKINKSKDFTLVILKKFNQGYQFSEWEGQKSTDTDPVDKSFNYFLSKIIQQTKAISAQMSLYTLYRKVVEDDEQAT